MSTPLIHQSHLLPRRLRPALAALVMAALLGCAPMLSSHGFIPEDDAVEKLRPGVHDRDSVTSLLGSPTSIADFNGETWLYVKRESEKVAFFNEDLLDQAVLLLRFDKDGLLTGIQRLAMTDGRNLVPVERTTPTRGREVTVIEQLFGNIGRFSNQEQ